MTTLGKYELHEQIGKGGFGTVYRAVDAESGNEVAVKVLHPQLMLDENFIKQFLKEGRILGSIDHPNIVKILDIGETDGRVFIVMKYMGGGSLEQRLINGPVNYREALRVLQQISAGLGAAHSKGWVHLDMKPANILFDLDGQAVISDFGLARTVQMTSSDERPGGTPFYRAPELWNGTPPVSHATDIYSLGCIFYEMITGRVLFPGKTPDQVLTRHLIHGPKFDPNALPRETPAWVLGVLQKAVARDPNQRYQRVEDFFRALITAPVETPHRKSKKWIAIGAGVVLIIGACPILAGIGLLSSGDLKILEPAAVSFLADMSTAFPIAPLPAVTSTSIAKPTKAAEEPVVCPVLPEPELTESGLIDEVIMARNTVGEEKNPVYLTRVFGGQDVFHAVVRITDAPENSSFKASWYVNDVGSDTNCNSIIDTTSISTSGNRNLDFTLIPEGTLLVGTYRVEIYVNDSLEKVEVFSVK